MSFIKIGLIIPCSFSEVWQTFARVQCSNFATQEEAQRYYERNGATWLDGDRDGEACECFYLAAVNMARVNAENINMNDRTLKCGLIFHLFFSFHLFEQYAGIPRRSFR